MQMIDKITLLKKINKAFFTISDFQKILKLKPESIKKALSRMIKKGLIRRLGRNIYVLADKGGDIQQIASQFYAPDAYISFESALSKYGIINQIPYMVTMATYKSPKMRPFLESEIALRKIKKELFFGYKLIDNMLLAEPEKALLDTLYLKSKGLTDLPWEELNLIDISKQKFLAMSKKFPPTVQREATRLAKKIK
jgi:predicted transcriptional regulator of viral defense system